MQAPDIATADGLAADFDRIVGKEEARAAVSVAQLYLTKRQGGTS